MLAASTLEMTLRMVVSLALIGAIALAAMKFGRGRFGPGLRRAGLAIVARQQLTKASSVAIVRAGDRTLLLGVTDHGVSLLAEGDDLVTVESGSSDESDSGTALDTSSDTSFAPVGDAVVDIRPDVGSDTSTGDAGTRRRRALPGSQPRMNVLETLRDYTVRR